jgi:hypothetical protein
VVLGSNQFQWGRHLAMSSMPEKGDEVMINYKDCPECGARKIRESVSLCEVCEISQRYETRLEQLQAMLDAAIKECDAVRVERTRLGEKLKKIENLSKNAWEQVNRNPVQSKELFWLIYHHSK